MSAVIVRIPPSPTGLLHVGTVRTALYNYLFAKKHGGKIIFRFEDTDKERNKKEYEDDILNGLQKLGLTFDEGPFYQSQRTEIYKKYLEELLANGKAYKCFCTKEELEAQRAEQAAKKLPPRHECACILNQDCQKDYVIRFKVPENREIVFTDLVRGEVKFHTREIADFVVAKSLTEPLYNFCVVVDDHEMAVTHIIRGEDGIPNTPKQILLYEAFGWSLPEFAHLPLILNEDKSKLSKRHNKVSVVDFLADGILPEALLNFLALLGWNTADEKEIFTLDELAAAFDLSAVHKGGAVFDEKKLLWINGVYLRGKSTAELKGLVAPYLERAGVDYLAKGEDFFEKALLMMRERMKKLSEFPDFMAFFFKDPFFNFPNTRGDLSFFFKNQKMGVDIPQAKKALTEGIALLKETSDWSEVALEEALVARIKELGWKNGQLLWPLRVALTGEQFSPGVFELLALFGKEESLRRLERGMVILG